MVFLRAGSPSFLVFVCPTKKIRSVFFSGGSSSGTVAAVQGRGPPKVRVWASWGSFCELPAERRPRNFGRSKDRDLRGPHPSASSKRPLPGDLLSLSPQGEGKRSSTQRILLPKKQQKHRPNTLPLPLPPPETLPNSIFRGLYFSAVRFSLFSVFGPFLRPIQKFKLTFECFCSVSGFFCF